MRSRFGPAVLALAMGGFAIGTTEFVTMGLLPEIAGGVGVSIPAAGHLISAYALGVVVGVPLITIAGARLPRKGLLISLMLAFAAGNGASALGTRFGEEFLFRFLAGLPHGAYFGVASLVASSMARPGRKARAVALVMLGLSVANVLGVPGATYLGQHLGWRSAYWAVAALALLTAFLVAVFVPRTGADVDATWRRELREFNSAQVWLTLLLGAIGFGGMFAVYSYIAPTITHLGGLPASAVPVFLLVFGVGMVLGTWLAGTLADWSILRSLLIGSVVMGVTLLVFALVASMGWLLLPVVLLVSSFSSIFVVTLQVRLMQVAGQAQTLGAAMNHASLNIANALGAWLGGMVLDAGWGYRGPALVGVGLSLAGLVVLTVSLRLHWVNTRVVRGPIKG